MNKAILMGRLTADPPLRHSQSGRAVTTFTLAVKRSFVTQGEERQSDFLNIVAWGKTAEFCCQYFRKGRQVAVVGRIQTRSWEDNNRQKRYATEIIADEVFFADSNPNQGQQQTAPVQTAVQPGATSYAQQPAVQVYAQQPAAQQQTIQNVVQDLANDMSQPTQTASNECWDVSQLNDEIPF